MKKQNIKYLKKKLDDIFSYFIRLRDSDENGYGKCITSGKPVYWKKADCGHWITRGCLATRYEEKNCALQSKYDNAFKDKQQMTKEFEKALRKRWGDKEIDKLEIKKYNTTKWTTFEYEYFIKEYQQKVKELMLNKNFKL